MNELTLPMPDPERVPMLLEKRQTLGAAKDAPDELSDRIAIGRPNGVPIDAAALEPDARRFLENRPGSAFWLLGLTCSFLAEDEAPLERAWLEVRLHAEEPASGAEPIAWSMEPLSLSKPREVSDVFKLDASLKLTTPGFPVEIGPSAAREKTVTAEEQLPYLEAHREGTARPSWIFTRTALTEIRGVHRLSAVIELPAGTRARAEVSAGATVKLKLLGLISYRAKLDELPQHQTVALG